MRTCNKCGIELTDDNWSPSFREHGHRTCRRCWAIYMKLWRARQEVRRLQNFATVLSNNLKSLDKSLGMELLSNE